LIFLSPPGERIEVRGNNSRTFFHPHPNPLPSREREFIVKAFLGGERGGFSFFGLDKESRVILYIQRSMQVGSTKGKKSCSETVKRKALSSRG
jgi:hypothetical protein